MKIFYPQKSFTKSLLHRIGKYYFFCTFILMLRKNFLIPYVMLMRDRRMYKKSFAVCLVLIFLMLPVLNFARAAPISQLSLVVVPATRSVPTDGREHPAFFITVVDGSQNPRLLTQSIVVTISSSDERILKVPSSVTINAGEYYTVVSGSSSILEKKSVEVAASASGFQASRASISVEPIAGTPTALKVTLLPNVFAPQVGGQAGVVVTLVDAYGKPTRARRDLNITITSSNPQIASLTDNWVILKRSSFSANTTLITTGFVGSSTVTASSSDIRSDSSTFTVSGAKPEKLFIWLPQYITTNETGFLPVMIVDKDSKPAKVPYPVKVSLYSTNSTILSVQSTITVDIEKWYTLVPIKSSKNYTGQVTLSASAQNITTATTVVNVIKSVGVPISLKSYTIGQNLPADESNYTGLMIQSLNRTGYPCKMNKTTLLSIFSSYVDILNVPASVNMPRNTSQYYVWSVPKLPGNIKVTVVAPNYFGSETVVSVYAPIPSSTNVIVPPIPAGGEVIACITFSGAGGPAPVQEETTISLSSSNTKVS